MNPLISQSPPEVAARLKSGTAVLVDVRESDEHAREHVVGAVTAPLSAFEAANLSLKPGQEVIFMCRGGNRTAAHSDRLLRHGAVAGGHAVEPGDALPLS